MKIRSHRSFANGLVYCLELKDGSLIETTDTFLPYYTKDCANGNNFLTSSDLGSRDERWLIGISVMSGCPVGCKFCATSQMKKWRNLTEDEIVEQIHFVLMQNDKHNPREFKINYTRMGDSFLNVHNVKQAIRRVNLFQPDTHHFVSTIGIRGSDFSWIRDNISLQISLHSLDEDRRKALIPVNNLMSIEELGQIRTKSNLKTTLNLSMVGEEDFDVEKLKKYFDPEHFFVKVSPINESEVTKKNGIGPGVIVAKNAR